MELLGVEFVITVLDGSPPGINECAEYSGACCVVFLCELVGVFNPLLGHIQAVRLHATTIGQEALILLVRKNG